MTRKAERDSLCAAVDEFAAAMKSRLLAKEREGYEGWDCMDADELVDDILLDAATLRSKHDQKSAVDIANRCMMVWRGNKK